MANKTWEMNAIQKDFVAVLKNYENGITLFELKLAGKEFKTGSINTLISKGIVEIAGEREFACEVVFNGQVVGKATKSGKIYKLVQKDQSVDRRSDYTTSVYMRGSNPLFFYANLHNRGSDRIDLSVGPNYTTGRGLCQVKSSSSNKNFLTNFFNMLFVKSFP